MTPIFYQSHLDTHLFRTYEGYNDNVKAFSSSEGLSLQIRLLYLFLYLCIVIPLTMFVILCNTAEYCHQHTLYQI